MSIVVVPAATEALRAKAFALRHAVFVGEQAVPVELERDELHAQWYVEAFYRRHGYARRGEEFEEAGIAHVVMRKAL